MYDAVATVCRLQVQVMVARSAGIEAVLVIDLARANLRRKFRHGRLIQREYQDRGVGASVGVGAVIVVRARLVDGSVGQCPVVFGAASIDCRFRISTVIHSEGQMHDAVAGARTPDGVGIHVRADRRCDNLEAILLVTVALTNGSRKVRDRFAAHRKMQNHRAVATVFRLQVQIVVARRAGIEAVLVIDLARANLCREFRRGRLVQRKHQDCGVGASVGIGAVIVVRAGLVEGGVGQCPVVFGSAGIDCRFRIRAMVHSEGQMHDAIATVCRLQVQVMVARCADVEAVLVIDLARANLRREFRCDRLIQRKHQDRSINASVGVDTVIVVRARLVDGSVGQCPVVFGSAGIHSRFRVIAAVHGERQMYDAVAGTRTPDGVGTHVSADRRCDNFEAVLMVTVALANGGSKVSDRFTAHGKVQDDRAIATVHRLQVQVVIARGADVKAVLVIDLARANLCRKFRYGRLVQRKQQDCRVGAGVGIGAVIVVRARLVDGGVGQCPVVFGAAGIHSDFRVGAVVHSDGQMYDAVAAVHRLQVQVVVARCADVEAVLVIDLTRTNLRREFRYGRLIQRKHQDCSVDASVGISAVIVVRAGLVDGSIGQCPVVFGTAGIHCGFRVGAVVHSEGQMYDAIATVLRLQVQVVVARRADVEAVLVIYLARTNLRREFRYGRLIQRKHQDCSVDASVGISAVIVVCARLVDGGVSQCPVVFGAADINCGFCIGTAVHSESQMHDAIASMNSLQRVRITARRSQWTAMENVSLSLADGLSNGYRHRHTGLDILNPISLFCIITFKTVHIRDIQRLDIQHKQTRLLGIIAQMQLIPHGIQSFHLKSFIQQIFSIIALQTHIQIVECRIHNGFVEHNRHFRQRRGNNCVGHIQDGIHFQNFCVQAKHQRIGGRKIIAECIHDMQLVFVNGVSANRQRDV